MGVGSVIGLATACHSERRGRLAIAIQFGASEQQRTAAGAHAAHAERWRPVAAGQRGARGVAARAVAADAAHARERRPVQPPLLEAPDGRCTSSACQEGYVCCDDSCGHGQDWRQMPTCAILMRPRMQQGLTCGTCGSFAARTAGGGPAALHQVVEPPPAAAAESPRVPA